MPNNYYHTRIPNSNTALLHPGDQLTYRELVTLLDEDFIEPTNSSRKKQLRDFQSLFSFTKGPGRKFTISEVYPTSLVEERLLQEQAQKKERVSSHSQQKEENKDLPDKILYPAHYASIHRSKYYFPFVNILFRYLPQHLGNPFYLIPNHLFSVFGITNPAYGRTNHHEPYPFRGGGTASKHEVAWFYQKSYPKFLEIVNHLLTDLTELEAITVSNSYLLYTEQAGFFRPTKQEVAAIKEAEEYALDDLELDSKPEVFIYNKVKDYYSHVCSELPYNFRAENYYSCYVIEVAPDILESCKPMEPKEYKSWRQQMNDLALQAFDKTITTFYQKHIEQSEDHYYSCNFVSTERRLMNELMRIQKSERSRRDT